MFDFRQFCVHRVALHLLLILFGAASSATAQGAAGAAGAAPTPTATPNTFAAAAGLSARTDYEAKHFALVFGAVALNPFNFANVTPAAGETPMMPPATPQIRLNTGSASVKPFLEGGFRYRWAWLDRYSLIQANEIAATANLEASEAAPTQEQRATALREARATALAAWKATQGKFAIFDLPSAWKVVDDSICGFRPDPDAPGTAAVGSPDVDHRSGCPADRFSWVVPDDWNIRLGYVFDQNSSLGAATLAGASSFYAEFAPGWNVLNFGLPTARPEEVPIRGSINFEPDLVMTSDNSLTQIHTRALFGMAFAIGVPLILLPDDNESPPAAALAPTPVPTPVPVVEFAVRLGGVYVDSPTFINDDTRLVQVQNEVPKFTQRWGYGMDAEMNVPLGRWPGYIMLRGSLNAGIDPSSWVLQAGYTVPIYTVASALRIAPESGSR